MGRRFAQLGADPHQPLDVGDDLVVLQADARRLEDLFARRVHADVDGVEPGLDHPASDLLGDERAVADHPDFLDAFLLGVADFLDELPVDERLPVVVDAHVGDAERCALVDDLAEEVERHDALPAMHLVARAEHALGVADVGALDLDDLREPGRAVAAGREQQPPDGFACRRSNDSAAWRARVRTLGPEGMLELLLAEVLDHARENLVELDGRRVADERLDLGNIRDPSRHVLEAGFVRLIVGDPDNL